MFSIDPSSGAETVLYSFLGGPDGAGPFASLINVKGILYGTTVAGGGAGCGGSGCGTVFTINRKIGVETVLHSFDGTDDPPARQRDQC